jgi:alcohol dehydrogenase class IV
MVNSFSISGVPRLVFGQGTLSRLPELAAGFGERYLLLTGASSFSSGEKGRTFLNSFENSSSVLYRGRIIKEPSPGDIDEIVHEHRGKEIDAIIAIGGGSVLDAGKAVSAMLPIGGTVKDYLEVIGKKKHPGFKIPFIAVPTTAGTGSEATTNAVLSEVGENGFKRSLRHPDFLPDIALLDPELTLGCTPEITAAGGMDALSQLIESYVSTISNFFTDSLAEKAIELIVKNLETAYSDGNNIKARSAMSYAAFISGITLANAGLGVVHGFASSIGALIDIPHGALCGSLVGIANRINVEKMIQSDPLNPALEKYSKLGKMLTGDKDSPVNENALGFVSFLDELTFRLKLPRLADYGLIDQDFDNIIRDTGQKNNPLKLNEDDLLTILKTRY